MSVNGGGNAAVTKAYAEHVLAENNRIMGQVGATRSVREGAWMLVTAVLVGVTYAFLLWAHDPSAWAGLVIAMAAIGVIIAARRRAAVSVHPRGFKGLYIASFIWLELVFSGAFILLKEANISHAIGLWPVPITVGAVAPYAALGIWLIVRRLSK